MQVALWIAVGAAIVCAIVAIYFSIKGKDKK